MNTKKALDEFQHWFDFGFSKSETPSSSALCYAMSALERQIAIERIMKPTWELDQEVE